MLTPSEGLPRNRFKLIVAIATGVGFVAALVALFILEQRHNFELAKLAAVIAVLFVMMGVIGITTLGPRNTPVGNGPAKPCRSTSALWAGFIATAGAMFS